MNRQFSIYFVVGAINTCFGYSSFALLNWLFLPRSAVALILAGVLSNLVNVTFSLITQKTFVFKTKGNIVREWMRFVSVSAGASLVGSALLPVLVYALKATTSANQSAPYLAWAILLIPSAFISFLGHQRFTFASH